MNKIGFNLLAWSAVLSDDLKPTIDRLQEIGYNGIEVLIGSPDANAYKRLGTYTKNQGLGITTVCVVGKDE
jgi:D-psicose/D-tagatose/L-ribulose 3-epimerase